MNWISIFRPLFDFTPFIGFETLLIRKQIEPQNGEGVSEFYHGAGA